MDAATGKQVSARVHYDLLIDEGNDPVLDPPVLKKYMDGWDGEEMSELLGLRPMHRALEIGVGTGRLALRMLERGCRELVGMDVSEKTLAAARVHLAKYPHARLMRGCFPVEAPDGLFDRIYSSLTFMHIPDKRAAVEKICALLTPDGRAVISLDKSRDEWLDMGTRKIRIFPDDPKTIRGFFEEGGCSCEVREIERAWLVCAGRCL